MIVKLYMEFLLLLLIYSLILGNEDNSFFIQIIYMIFTTMNILFIIKSEIHANCHSYQGNNYGCCFVLLK